MCGEMTKSIVLINCPCKIDLHRQCTVFVPQHLYDMHVYMTVSF